MNAETLGMIIMVAGIIVLAGIVWYTERVRRRAAELAEALVRARIQTDATKAKLDEQIKTYEDAKRALDEHPIPPDMLEHVGRSDIGAAVHRPGIDGTVVDSGGPGEAKPIC